MMLSQAPAAADVDPARHAPYRYRLPADLDPPPVLAGRYRLLEPLGEGATGVVYHGFDHELEEHVAIKLLRPELTNNAAARASLRREVSLSRRITHPNIVRVFDLGVDHGRDFLTMEYLPGESLHEHLARAAPLPSAQVAGLALDLCRGLLAAHEVGVTHGDVKPGNVLLQPGRGAVLADFGIARGLAESSTSAGTFAGGTISYIAPELLRGAPASAAADLYSLAALLVEALTGVLPWPAADPLQTIAHKLDGPPPDLAGLAPRWRDLLATCLQRLPHDRPDAPTLRDRLLAIHNDASSDRPPT